mmetsp:Transcript_12023/g.29231  ORF Transcript_12023/g.29231 Transcript_12023/m.29231 type:complete len:333 (-) Transcript_12023:384-1382(-)
MSHHDRLSAGGCMASVNAAAEASRYHSPPWRQFGCVGGPRRAAQGLGRPGAEGGRVGLASRLLSAGCQPWDAGRGVGGEEGWGRKRQMPAAADEVPVQAQPGEKGRLQDGAVEKRVCEVPRRDPGGFPDQAGGPSQMDGAPAGWGLVRERGGLLGAERPGCTVPRRRGHVGKRDVHGKLKVLAEDGPPPHGRRGGGDLQRRPGDQPNLLQLHKGLGNVLRRRVVQRVPRAPRGGQGGREALLPREAHPGERGGGAARGPRARSSRRADAQGHQRGGARRLAGGGLGEAGRPRACGRCGPGGRGDLRRHRRRQGRGRVHKPLQERLRDAALCR